jgi:hypothetical protein
MACFVHVEYQTGKQRKCSKKIPVDVFCRSAADQPTAVIFLQQEVQNSI